MTAHLIVSIMISLFAHISISLWPRPIIMHLPSVIDVRIPMSPLICLPLSSISISMLNKELDPHLPKIT